MNVSAISDGNSGAVQSAQVVARLVPQAVHDDGSPLDFNKDYSINGDTLAQAWQLKDAEALRAWSGPNMARVFRWIAEWNTMESDYLDRAVHINMDSSLWHQLLVQQGKIKPLPGEWRQAIEIASLVLDIGDDGLGGEGFKQALAGAGVLSPIIAAKVAALVGRTGKTGGLWAEHAFEQSKALPYMQLLVRETQQSTPSSFRRKKGSIPAIPDQVAYQAALKELSDPTWLKTAADRTAFATALYIVKLADNSRGSAHQAARRGGIVALTGNTRYTQSIGNFERARAQYGVR